MPLPIPPPAPVTTAVLPVNESPMGEEYSACPPVVGRAPFQAQSNGTRRHRLPAPVRPLR